MSVTNVKSKWVDGNLYFYDKSDNVIAVFDGDKSKLMPYMGITTKTAVATLTAAEGGIILVNTDNVTINLPTAIGNTGLWYVIKQIATKSAGITVDPYSTQTIDGSTTLTNGATNDALGIVSDGANWKAFSKIGTWS